MTEPYLHSLNDIYEEMRMGRLVETIEECAENRLLDWDYAQYLVENPRECQQWIYDNLGLDI